MTDGEWWDIPREWEGQTAFILGGGASLRGFDFERLRGSRIIAINRMFRLCPFADVVYFCDKHWWTLDGEEVRRTFTGSHVITIGRVDDPLVKRLRNMGAQGLSTSASGVKHGTNSGYQSINLAYLFGASRICLLGFDMKVAEDGVTHAHGGYGTGAAEMAHVLGKRMLPFFDRLVEPLKIAGVDVINCNPDSALECWPKMPLEEAVLKFATCAKSPS